MDIVAASSRTHNSEFFQSGEHFILTPVFFLYRTQVEEQVEYAVDRLMFGTAALEDGMTIEEAGLETESSIDALVALDGGKRKRKKKVYTKPKKVKHKHKKRAPMAILDYYDVESSGKIRRLKNESPMAEPGTYMADHADRFTCGKTGYMLYKLTAKGERLPIPENKKPAVAQAAAAAPAKKDAGKKKKK